MRWPKLVPVPKRTCPAGVTQAMENLPAVALTVLNLAAVDVLASELRRSTGEIGLTRDLGRHGGKADILGAS